MPSASRKRRYRLRGAVLNEFRIRGRFSELPSNLQAAVDALIEARDAAKHAGRDSDPEVRSRTSNTAARRARELAALLEGDEKTVGALVDRLSDEEFIALSRRAYLGEGEGLAELDRLCADNAEAVMRRTLAGPPWWVIEPERAEEKKPQAVAVEASEPPVDAQQSDVDETD